MATIYRLCNVLFSNRDMPLIKNLYRFKNTVLDDTDEVFDDKLQNAKTENVTNNECSTDQRHETGRQKHARTEENVTSGDKNGKLTKSQRPQINTPLNEKDIQRNRSNKVWHRKDCSRSFFWLEVYFVYQHACYQLLLVFMHLYFTQ